MASGAGFMNVSASDPTAYYYALVANCTSVTPDCPVILTVYGFYPSLAANAFFAAWFFLFLFPIALLAWRSKTWAYSAFLFTGTLSEGLGYVGRILMHSNPWSNGAFKLQIVTLIYAPSFFAASIYLTLKHIARTIGPNQSPLNPNMYPIVFIGADCISLLLQAIGGGIAASADDLETSNIGANIMLTGIVFQVFTMSVLFFLAIVFYFRVHRQRAATNLPSLGLDRKSFIIFLSGVSVASLFIYVRCVYRIAELSGGWANPVMRDEAGFIVADGVMCVVAVTGLTVCHPGIFFRGSTMVPDGEKEKSSGPRDAAPGSHVVKPEHKLNDLEPTTIEGLQEENIIRVISHRRNSSVRR